MRSDSLQSAHAELAAGHPRQAARLFGASGVSEGATLGLVACLLRLGAVEEAGEHLRQLPPNARRAALQARLLWLTGDPAVLPAAQDARRLARAEGDDPALVAAVTLLGDLEHRAGDARTALHTLAEGLKVSEAAGEAADAHLLAVLARVQATIGSASKAHRTAEKALARSQPGSPARVAALLALGQSDEARREAEAGELAPAYLS